MGRSRTLTAWLALLAVIGPVCPPAAADEGGVSFWLPGTFGSLAATPQQPGWSFASIFYATSVSAGRDVSRAREFRVGRVPVGAEVNGNLQLDADGELGLVIPSYVFATPVLGGQAAVSLMGIYGRSGTSIAGTLDGVLTTLGGPISFTRSGSLGDTVWGFGDLYPQVSLKWNRGVHNFMTYVTGDVPVGAYDADRLSNIGIGHGAIDAGGGYTYFDPQTGHEFSAVLGATYNFENPSTDYQNGIDLHLDWGASQFLSPQWQVGLVGYAYKQITPDGGSGDHVGAFESQVFGIGPQIGHVFPVGQLQGYLNLKGYKEFGARNRPEGLNVWLTFALAPAPGAPAKK